MPEEILMEDIKKQIEKLSSVKSSEVIEAAASLQEIGTPAQDALKSLWDVASNNFSQQARDSAIKAIKAIQTDKTSLIDEFIKRLNKQPLGPHLPEVLEKMDLSEEDVLERNKAHDALWEFVHNCDENGPTYWKVFKAIVYSTRRIENNDSRADTKIFRNIETDYQIKSLVKSRFMLLPELGVSLNTVWKKGDTNKETFFLPQMILALHDSAPMEDSKKTVRLEALKWLRERIGQVPPKWYSKLVEVLKEIQDPRQDIQSFSELFLSEIEQLLNIKKQKEFRQSFWIANLWGDDLDKQYSTVDEILGVGTREAVQFLVREWIQLIAHGDKASLVERIAETLRYNEHSVSPLIQYSGQKLQRDEKLEDKIRSQIIREKASSKYHNLLKEICEDNFNDSLKRELEDWLEAFEDASDGFADLRKLCLEKKWNDAQFAKKIIEFLIDEKLKNREIEVKQKIARQLADMSDPKYFEKDERSQRTYEAIKRVVMDYVIPIFSKRLPIEQDIDTRESMARTLGNVGGQFAVDALVQAVVGEERTRRERQELLARYYLEPSKARSEEAAKMLEKAANEAKRTLWLLQWLNGFVFGTGLLVLLVGLGTSIWSKDTGTRAIGAMAGLGGLAGVVVQLVRDPLNRIQNAMANLVQVETAFTSFIWELNLNGTYIQSQYVKEGVLRDYEISQTTNRIENAMHLTMDLVATYTVDGNQRIVTRISSLSPATANVGDIITIHGQHLQGDSTHRKEKAGLVAISHKPIADPISWTKGEVKFKLPEFAAADETAWISLFVDGMETNALPLHILKKNVQQSKLVETDTLTDALKKVMDKVEDKVVDIARENL